MLWRGTIRHHGSFTMAKTYKLLSFLWSYIKISLMGLCFSFLQSPNYIYVDPLQWPCNFFYSFFSSTAIYSNYNFTILFWKESTLICRQQSPSPISIEVCVVYNMPSIIFLWGKALGCALVFPLLVFYEPPPPPVAAGIVKGPWPFLSPQCCLQESRQGPLERQPLHFRRCLSPPEIYWCLRLSHLYSRLGIPQWLCKQMNIFTIYIPKYI